MPFKKIVQVIIELPLSLPNLVLGLCLLIVFSSDFGKSLKDIGFKVIFDRNGIILAQLIVNLPFSIRLVRTAMSAVDPRLEFIAGTLGASRWKRFRTILLPLCRSSILMMLVLVWSRALGEFGATLMTKNISGSVPASLLAPTCCLLDELILICSSSHRFAGLSAIDPAELEKEDFIIRETGSGTRKIFESAMRRTVLYCSCLLYFCSSLTASSTHQLFLPAI